MMDPSEINNFEDQWRKALKEASEAPPQSVWEGIEARLDQQDKGMILPLWWQSSKLWYAAASIVALLLVGGGIWYSNSKMNGNKINTEIAVKQNTKENVTTDKKTPEAETEEAETSADAKANLQAETSAPTEKSQQTETSADAGQEQLAVVKSKKGSATAIRKPAISNENQTLAFERSPESAASTSSEKPAFTNTKTPASSVIDNNAGLANGVAEVANAPANVANAPSESTMSVALLPTTPYSDLDIHMQKRYVFFQPDAIKEEPLTPVKHTEYYAGLSLMPASFNPNLTVKEAPVGFSGQSLSMRRAVSGTSEAGASYAVQTQGGMKISKHWSLEMGVSYLKGNSTYEGGGYVLNAFSNKSANVLENAYAGLASGYAGVNGDKTADFVNNGALYIDVAKTVSNNYQYLQLPVQAGFTLYPEKKFNASILGGMMANFFLSNELESASGEIITTKASDEIYRSMNWAATTGLRFNYRLSPRWNANLTGSYQKSVTSGFRSTQSLDSRPYLYGVSWGMRYSF